MGRFLTKDDLDDLKRVHLPPLLWGEVPGTDFWIVGGAPSIAGATTFLASSVGWTTTAMSSTAGSLADFMSSADKGTLQISDFGASGDLVSSPRIFGDYINSRAAAMIFGRVALPRYLIADVFATFSTASADENTSGFGFTIGTPATATNHVAYIRSNGTVFQLRGAVVTAGAGAAVDNNPHWWRIIFDRITGTTAGVSWYIDGVLQGSIDIEQDLWPASFSAHVLTTNRLGLHMAHIYYSYSLPADSLTT